MSLIKVKFKNEEKEYEKGILISEIAEEYKDDYKHDILVATVDNRVTSLDTKLNKNCTLDFCDISSHSGHVAYENGIFFLFSVAVREILNCDVKLLHSLDKGVYGEILTNNLISEVTIEKIKIKMKELCSSNLPITKIMVSRIDAIEYYNKINQMDKANSLRYISNSSISLYKLSDTLDFFYGILPNNTKLLKKFNVKFLKDNKLIQDEKLLNSLEENDKYLESLKINTSVELNKMISSGNYGDLIRVSEAISNNELFDIADKISKEKDLKVVLITGPSSSGKTTTARKLALFLKSKGLSPIPISVDDFYMDMKDRVLDENGEPEKEKIDAIDTSLFNKKISELLNKKEVYMP